MACTSSQPQLRSDDRFPSSNLAGRESKHIALAIPSLAGGGAERVALNLARAFSAHGHQVDLIVCRFAGELRNQFPDRVRLVELRGASIVWSRLRVLAADPAGFKSVARPVLLPIEASNRVRYLPDLVRYLRRERPQILLSATNNLNLVALWARRLAGVPTRLVVSEHNNLSQERQADSNQRKWRWRFLPQVISRTYPWADAIIAVSAGVADDLSVRARIPRKRILTIHNPVVTPELEEKSRAPCAHPWFASSSPPVVLAVGRLAAQKDFPTLLRAFARVRRLRSVRLVILGEGGERTKLEALARELGIAADATLPGFVCNPYPYMVRAAVCALCSVYEGLPSVLIEALACGCPVVSTDCPSGPAEILEDGAYGALVPVADDAAMAEAINTALDRARDSQRLKARAAEFSLKRAAERYLAVLCGVQASRPV
ncbi:MAG: glycosyltransferase [Acidobacteriota bacterium]|nr:glycosyltransferase [Acidobacteriota bacterium]